MKKITETYIFRIVAVILILSLTLYGCDRNKKEVTVSDPVAPVTNGTDLDIMVEETESAMLDSVKPGVIFESKVAGSASDDGVYSEGSYDYGEFVEAVTSDEIGGEPSYPIEPIVPIDPEVPWEPEPTVAPHAGLLTAGEWNDNVHMDFLRNLLANGQEQNYKEFFKAWNLCPFNRLTVHVTDTDGADLQNISVTALNAAGSPVGSACTNNHGVAYIFYNLTDNTEEIPASVNVQYGDLAMNSEVMSIDLMDESVLEISFADAERKPKQLDLMMVVDTTGSMGDEIRYLQTELEDVIERVSRNNANLPIRLSVNFYRDMDDDYVVKSHPFSSNIDEQMAYLRVEYADGGGDYEEAVELALEDAVNNHDWSEDSTKIMFLVLDAPPHNASDIRASLASTLADAAAKGIRIIPIASSGVDKSTEFLLRTFAMVTGGTYTFLTNDSGIGGDHIEPTIGSYDVEYLNDLMVRIIDEYLR